MADLPFPRLTSSFHTDDIDALAEAMRAWDLDFRPLRAGGGTVRQLAGPELLYMRAELDAAVHQQGCAPSGFRTLAVLERPQPLRWCGRDLDGETLMLKPANGAFEAVSRPGFAVETLSVSEARLAQAAEEAGVDPDRALPQDPRAIERHPATAARVHTALARLRRAAENGAAGDPPALWEELEETVAGLFLSAIAGAPRLRPPAPTLRDRAVGHALAALHEQPHETMRVADLARAAGVSERTLRYAFQDRFGVSPKAYLSAVRMQQVRRALRAADPAETRVSDVANRFGFWHMGQLAADYRRRFGELPSATLARAAGLAGATGS